MLRVGGQPTGRRATSDPDGSEPTGNMAETEANATQGDVEPDSRGIERAPRRAAITRTRSTTRRTSSRRWQRSASAQRRSPRDATRSVSGQVALYVPTLGSSASLTTPVAVSRTPWLARWVGGSPAVSKCARRGRSASEPGPDGAGRHADGAGGVSSRGSPMRALNSSCPLRGHTRSRSTSRLRRRTPATNGRTFVPRDANPQTGR